METIETLRHQVQKAREYLGGTGPDTTDNMLRWTNLELAARRLADAAASSLELFTEVARNQADLDRRLRLIEDPPGTPFE